MAKVKTAGIIASASGKVGKDSDTVLCTNHVTNKTYTRKIVKSAKPRTEKQQANSLAFKEKAEKVSKWLRDNRPSEANPKGTPAYQKVYKAFHSQRTIGTIYSYVWRKLEKLCP